MNSLGNDATIFVRNENRFNEIAGVLSDNPPTLLANIKSVDDIVAHSSTESQEQNSGQNSVAFDDPNTVTGLSDAALIMRVDVGKQVELTVDQKKLVRAYQEEARDLQETKEKLAELRLDVRTLREMDRAAENRQRTQYNERIKNLEKQIREMESRMNRKPGETVQGAMLRVISHELTHSFEKFSPVQYQELHDYIVSNAIKKHGIDGYNAALQSLRKALEEAGDTTVINAAETEKRSVVESEFIARSCEQLLSSSAAFTDLMRQNMTLGEKVKSWVTDFINNWKSAIENNPSAVKGEQELLKDCIAEVQKKWDACLKETAENLKEIDRGEGIKNTATEGGEVQYSLSDAVAPTFDDLLKKIQLPL